MGLGASHRGGSAPSHRPELTRPRRPSIRHTISSFFLCGGSPSPSLVVEDCPAELLMTSAEIGGGERLNGKRKGPRLPLGRKTALVDDGITKYRVSSGRCTTGNEIAALETVPGDAGPGDKGNCLSKCGDMISCQPTASSSDDGTASTSSSILQPSPDRVSDTETAKFDASKDITSITSSDSSQISLDEVLAGNNIAEAIDSYSEDTSFYHDSPVAFHLMQDDNIQGSMPLTSGFILLGREENRQEGTLRQGDLMNASSNSLSSVSPNSHDIRNYTSFSFSRNTVFSMNGSEYSSSPAVSHHDLSADFFSDNLHGSFTSLGSEIHGSNELGERLHGSLDTTDPNDVCPRMIHAGSSCLCRVGLSAEASGSRAISRMVFLAQTWFEVLHQIHQQHPISISLSVVSQPAPESVVASLPMKIHVKENISECEEDISQCHICLGAYENGDKIRVLPCQHEYHMSCVDKWLQEVHGVCPLCRGDVYKGLIEASCSNLDILPR
ncbi:RING-type E3 ubiquitin transferase [Salvia divinorum]|uniref:RING-type E3 ubiquitin transferase n=1 Tax=Salvia divinorum TaxID=28513 RepID=A0ABD1FKM3_SALDI